MVKRTAALLLVLGLLLCGCGKTESSETEVTVAPETTEETVPATIPQDGNPNTSRRAAVLFTMKHHLPLFCNNTIYYHTLRNIASTVLREYPLAFLDTFGYNLK